VTDREKFEAWAVDHQTMDGYPQYTPFDAWQASRRAAIKEAHSACLAGVKWSPEPSKQIQFYVNGTCHRLAAEISNLADGGTHD
jgi:hypothetical protein